MSLHVPTVERQLVPESAPGDWSASQFLFSLAIPSACTTPQSLQGGVVSKSILIPSQRVQATSSIVVQSLEIPFGNQTLAAALGPDCFSSSTGTETNRLRPMPLLSPFRTSFPLPPVCFVSLFCGRPPPPYLGTLHLCTSRSILHKSHQSILAISNQLQSGCRRLYCLA